MHVPPKSSLVSLTIIRYPKKYVLPALFAMAIHRLPLMNNKKIQFWKLLGCGKGGSFSKKPDWQQWAILAVRDAVALPDTQQELLKTLYGKFITAWYKRWHCETHTFLLEPVSGHGMWNGKTPFNIPHGNQLHTGRIAVLTRATIRLKKLSRFWAHVHETSALLHKAKGLVYSVSIGEIPLIKQATFSIWNSTEEMVAFAYATQHADVVKKTRDEKWYAEELFVRFRILKEIKASK